MGEYKIGYIDTYHSGRNAFIGGVLVVDRIGIPVEFRHTETLVPTKIQALLYGKALDKYLKCETLAKCLLNDLENKPDLLVVPDEDYFVLTRLFRFPFVMVGVARQEPLPAHGEFREVSENEILLQILSVREPVRIRVDRKNAPTLVGVKQVLLDVGRTMDVVEPLARVQDALKTILAEEGPGGLG